ncbi:MAG: flagellar basal body P-ring formation chaperone FlgA [Endozoicomonas sp.]
MPFRILVLFITFLMLLLPIGKTMASGNDDVLHEVTKHLDTSVKKFLENHQGSKYSITVRPPKSGFDSCPNNLRIYQNIRNKPPTGTVRLNVECPGIWKTYVLANVEALLPAILSNQNLSRGDVITKEQLQIGQLSISKLRGNYFTNLEQLEGRKLNRSITVGRVIQESALVPLYLVFKGQSVSIQSGNGALFVSMSGIALENGLLNEVIRVRNRSSGTIIDARVISEDKVTAAL